MMLPCFFRRYMVQRLSYYLNLWKLTKITKLVKSGKKVHKLTSQGPNSILPVLSNVLKNTADTIETNSGTHIPSHQFEFRQKHSSIGQTYKITQFIRITLEQIYSSTTFTDIHQAFKKAWYQGSLCKLNGNCCPLPL